MAFKLNGERWKEFVIDPSDGRTLGFVYLFVGAVGNGEIGFWVDLDGIVDFRHVVLTDLGKKRAEEAGFL